MPIGKLAYYCWSDLDRITATYGDCDALVLDYTAAMLEGRLPQYFHERLEAYNRKMDGRNPRVRALLRVGVERLLGAPSARALHLESRKCSINISSFQIFFFLFVWDAPS